MIRIVAYNVSRGLDLGAAGRVLDELRPDVVCVLEAPGPKRLRGLARAADLEVAARSGRRASGTAVLVSRAAHVRSSSEVPLTTPKDVPARAATHAILSFAGVGLSVTAVQFGLRPEVRRLNLDELLTFLASVDVPSVIGADLNESIRSPVAAELASRYQDAFAVASTAGDGATYPTSDPSTRQDFVFVNAGLTVRHAHVPSGPEVDSASHHRPVVADVELRAPGDAAEIP